MQTSLVAETKATHSTETSVFFFGKCLRQNPLAIVPMMVGPRNRCDPVPLLRVATTPHNPWFSQTPVDLTRTGQSREVDPGTWEVHQPTKPNKPLAPCGMRNLPSAWTTWPVVRLRASDGDLRAAPSNGVHFPRASVTTLCVRGRVLGWDIADEMVATTASQHTGPKVAARTVSLALTVHKSHFHTKGAGRPNF